MSSRSCLEGEADRGEGGLLAVVFFTVSFAAGIDALRALESVLRAFLATVIGMGRGSRAEAPLAEPTILKSTAVCPDSGEFASAGAAIAKGAVIELSVLSV